MGAVKLTKRCACAHRAQILRVAVRDPLEMLPYRPPANLPNVAMVYAEVTTITDKGRPAELQADDVIARLIRSFRGQARRPAWRAWGWRMGPAHGPGGARAHNAL